MRSSAIWHANASARFTACSLSSIQILVSLSDASLFSARALELLALEITIRRLCDRLA